MKKLLHAAKFFTILGCIFANHLVFAQPEQIEQAEEQTVEVEKEYKHTYITDKRYSVIYELEEEQFFPAGYQLEQSTPEDVAAGQIIVSIYSQKIWIQGIEDIGTFHIISKKADKVGFVYELMDENNTPARFKVVTDQNRYVNLLYLYSKTLGEHTFFLAEKEETEVAADNNYYTSQEQFFVRSFRNLINKTIKPYAMMTSIVESNETTKIEQSQNINFEFTDKNITTPEGTYTIKEANTYEYKLTGYPGVRSMIEVSLKGKRDKLYIFLNFKQQIEIIEMGEFRYFLMK